MTGTTRTWPAPPNREGVNWRALILAAVMIVLFWQVIVPFGMIVWTSLKTTRPGDPEFLTLSLSLSNYRRALGDPGFWTTARNTLVFALASTLFAFIPGAFVAWVVERTNAPFARLIGLILTARVVIPGVLITISWILLASPRIGILNFVWRDLFGVVNFFNVYSMSGMIFVHALEMAPLAFLLLSAAFQSMDPRLEEAAIMAGAGTFGALRRVTLPLATPAVGTALLLLFITSIETFEVPLLMGGRAGVRVLASEIFLSTSRTPVDWGLASACAMAMVALTIFLLFLYLRLLRHGERYQTVSGKDFRPRRVDLGPWRAPVSALSLLIVFFITGAPLLVMVYASLLPAWQPPSMAYFSMMTLANYEALFRNSSALTPLLNSTLLGVGSASVIVLLAALIAWFTQKSRLRGRRILDFVAFASIALPSVVLGATFLWLYLIVPLPVIGTLTIIGLAYVTKYLPYALRFVTTSMTQLHSELEEAAHMAGAPWWRTFATITLPLLKPGLLAAWFWVMVHAYRELTIALMLARSQNRTAAVLILDLWEQGSFLRLSAFGVVIFTVLLVLVGLSHAIGQRIGVREQA